MLFAVYGLFKKSISYPETDTLGKFAVLIPARNEEAVIGNLIESIKNADYPSELIEIYVVINSCTDGTMEAALSHGAKIIDCTQPTKTKGEVLRFAFKELADRSDIDIYAIFDADNVVDANFFSEMNKAVAAGADAAQGLRRDKNMRETWVAATYEIYYAVQNAFVNHPRNAAGMSAAISGTGWVITKEAVDTDGFDMTTIAEDLEISCQLVANDRHIAYCKEAEVFDEYTEDFKVSIVQRLRWSAGLWQCLVKWELPLLKKAFAGSGQALSMAHINLTPPVMLAGIFMPFFAYFLLKIEVNFFLFLLSMLAIFWIVVSTAAAIAVLKSGLSLRDNLKGVLCFPLFLLTWAPLVLYCFFKRQVDWTPIKHEEVVSIEERESVL